jgi:hypothetical protein
MIWLNYALDVLSCIISIVCRSASKEDRVMLEVCVRPPGAGLVRILVLVLPAPGC